MQLHDIQAGAHFEPEMKREEGVLMNRRRAEAKQRAWNFKNSDDPSGYRQESDLSSSAAVSDTSRFQFDPPLSSR